MEVVTPSVSRFEVWLVNLDPTRGREIKKTRPSVIISPDEMSPLSTVLVAPMTTNGFEFPGRLRCTFNKKSGLILLDHIRSVDKSRLVKCLGSVDQGTKQSLCDLLQEFFAC